MGQVFRFNAEDPTRPKMLQCAVGQRRKKRTKLRFLDAIEQDLKL